MQFNELLNDYVSRIGISYKALAQEAGMTAGVISRYKNGSRLPSIKTGAARKLAEAVATLAVQNGIETTADEVEAAFLETLRQPAAAKSGPAAKSAEAVTAAPVVEPKPVEAPAVPEAAPVQPTASSPKPPEKVRTYRRAKGLRKAQVDFFEAVMQDSEVKRLFIYQSMPTELDRNYLTEIMAGGVHVFLAVHMPRHPFKVIKSFLDWWPLYRSGRLHLYLTRGGSDPGVFGKAYYYTKKTALSMECMGGDLFYGKAVAMEEGRRLAALKRRMAFIFKLSKRLI